MEPSNGCQKQRSWVLRFYREALSLEKIILVINLAWT
jgi:hypothetical protein